MKVACSAEPPCGNPWWKLREQEMKWHSDKPWRFLWCLLSQHNLAYLDYIPANPQANSSHFCFLSEDLIPTWVLTLSMAFLFSFISRSMRCVPGRAEQYHYISMSSQTPNTHTYAITVLTIPTTFLNLNTCLLHFCALGYSEDIRWIGLNLCYDFKPILESTQVAKKAASNYLMLGVQPPVV